MKQFKTYRMGVPALRTWMPGLLLAGLLGCWPAVQGATQGPAQLRYPLTSDGVDSRYDYDWAVLRAALEKTAPRFGAFELRPSDAPMSPQRITQEMQTPAGRINIFVRATSPALEHDLLPVRLPIDRGLLGYRVFLVRAADLPRFAKVRTLDDLRRLRAGQGKGWADVSILTAAGIPVVEGSTYEGLFAMLDEGRFDFFSRSLDEALREFDERHASHPQEAIETTLLLHYPLPRYFFLRRDAEGQQLAKRIVAGMEMMLRDGSLNALFYHYKGGIIERAGLKGRRVLTLANPTLTPETPLQRRELWYEPLSGK